MPGAPARRADPRHELGTRGERLAARWLRRRGYKVLYRNFRPAQGGGEIDLVCRHADTLVFVEVKTRRRVDFGRPAEAVDAEKQELVQRGARAWLRLLRNPAVVYRFDIVEVLAEPGKDAVCTVIENAFALSER